MEPSYYRDFIHPFFKDPEHFALLKKSKSILAGNNRPFVYKVHVRDMQPEGQQYAQISIMFVPENAENVSEMHMSICELVKKHADDCVDTSHGFWFSKFSLRSRKYILFDSGRAFFVDVRVDETHVQCSLYAIALDNISVLEKLLWVEHHSFRCRNGSALIQSMFGKECYSVASLLQKLRDQKLYVANTICLVCGGHFITQLAPKVAHRG